jgi:pyridoxamine 5'-phosphate oxidase family protein
MNQAETPEGEAATFSDAELRYLGESHLGRLATVDPSGMPHVVPLGWTYNRQLGTIDIGGRNNARTRKYRNVHANHNAALVIDDVLPPWHPRAVMIRGHAQALDEAVDADGRPTGPIIRLTPRRITSWGLVDQSG